MPEVCIDKMREKDNERFCSNNIEHQNFRVVRLTMHAAVFTCVMRVCLCVFHIFFFYGQPSISFRIATAIRGINMFLLLICAEANYNRSPGHVRHKRYSHIHITYVHIEYILSNFTLCRSTYTTSRRQKGDDTARWRKRGRNVQEAAKFEEGGCC